MLNSDFTKYTFFCGGPFSQWYPSKFVIGTGSSDTDIEFNCAEQAMMYFKAVLFNDFDTASLIMNALGPKEMKALGRQVRNFEEDRWVKFREVIVKTINYEKFKQNRHLFEKLMETKGTLLVEASPSDIIWGIGLGMNDERRFDPLKWRGQNLLGKTLTQVRLKFEREGWGLKFEREW